MHPINLAGACWAEVVSHLELQRFCILPDLRGHGGSEANGPYGIDAWAADCFAVLDHFKIGRAHVVGGSLGGPLAVVLAARAPGCITSIAAFGSALKIEGEGLDEVIGILRDKGVRETFRLLIPELSVAPDTAPEIIERILTLTNPNDVETVTAIWTAAISTDVRHCAREVRCPALVGCGAHDKTCTPAQAAEMAEALGTELVTIPGIGHIPMLEAPEATAALISQHLARHDGSSKAVR
ncbi:MAG: alpha/beta fold hydrolase [Candidatus Binatia bacterium]